MNTNHPKYYRIEMWNTLSHGLALVLALLGGGYLIWIASDFLHLPDMVAISIYIIGAVFVYASSTAYHALAPGDRKEKLQQVDHISIYFMIAGTHTPIIIRYFNNSEGYIFLGIMWSLVFLGTIYKVFWMGKYETLGLLLYIGMGCMSIALGPQMVELIAPHILGLIIAGGVLYFTGVIFYCWEKLPYNHPIWHLFVVAGSLAHFIAIYFIVVGA